VCSGGGSGSGGGGGGCFAACFAFGVSWVPHPLSSYKHINNNNTHPYTKHTPLYIHTKVNYPLLPRVRRGLLLRWVLLFIAAGSLELLLIDQLLVPNLLAGLRPLAALDGAPLFERLLGLALPIGVEMAMALYFLAGLVQSKSMLSLSIILLRTTDERFRGRVMGVRMLAIYTLPMGLLAAGALIPLLGFVALVMLYVSLGLLVLALLAWVWRHELWSRQARANAL
jgi:hypothetical protein